MSIQRILTKHSQNSKVSIPLLLQVSEPSTFNKGFQTNQILTVSELFSNRTESTRSLNHSAIALNPSLSAFQSTTSKVSTPISQNSFSIRITTTSRRPPKLPKNPKAITRISTRRIHSKGTSKLFHYQQRTPTHCRHSGSITDLLQFRQRWGMHRRLS